MNLRKDPDHHDKKQAKNIISTSKQMIAVRRQGQGGTYRILTSGGRSNAQVQSGQISLPLVPPVKIEGSGDEEGGQQFVLGQNQNNTQNQFGWLGPQLIQTPDGQMFIYQPAVSMDGDGPTLQAIKNESFLGNFTDVSPIGSSSTSGTLQPTTIGINGCHYTTKQSLASNSNTNQVGHPPTTETETLDEETLYVNPKQYYRILKRREARAKLITQGRIPKDRPKYLHESRHRHAANRTRDENGRFNPRPVNNRQATGHTEPLPESSHTAETPEPLTPLLKPK